MADALVNQYGADVPRRIAAHIKAVYSTFAERQFIQYCMQDYDALPLMARGRRIAEALALCLPKDFNQAADILLAALVTPLTDGDDSAMSSFIYLPYSFYVSDQGIAYHERSMELLYIITQRFTAEFAIRRFLIENSVATLQTLRGWCDDPSEHVRRLVSEGTRPRLPWAMRLPAFQQDPTLVIELLERLKDDESEYVRRSVANNLNDISKDHPQRVLDVAQSWLQQAGQQRQRLVRHGLRTLVKAGDANALMLLGYGATSDVKVSRIKLFPDAPQMGSEVVISCEMSNVGLLTQSICVDLMVNYVRSRGSFRVKVFKWKLLNLVAGETAQLQYRLSLKERTTRRHYPGMHELTALVNGQRVSLGAFNLQSAN